MRTYIKYYTPDINVVVKNGFIALSDNHEIKDGITVKNLKEKWTTCSSRKDIYNTLGGINFSKSNYKEKPGGLFLIFSNLKSVDEIIEFIAKYGFLGLNLPSMHNIISRTLRLEGLLNPIEEFVLTDYKESIEDIEKEIDKIKNIVVAFQRYRDMLAQLEKEENVSIKLEEICSIEDECDAAVKNINVAMQNIAFDVSWVGDGRLDSRWNTETLLQSMYIELVEKFSGHLMPRICLECGRTFIPTREDNVYCQLGNYGGKSCKEIAKQKRFIKNRRDKMKQGSPE